MKKWYTSKTILVQLIASLALVVAQYQPELAQLISENFSEVGMGWIAINLLLRFVTKDKVQLS